MVTLVSICLLTITVDYRSGDKGPLEGIGRLGLTIITPLQKAVAGITRPVGDFLSAITSLPTLKQENDELRAELEQAKAALSAQSGLQAEIAELTKLLDLPLTQERRTTGATVISNGVSNFEWSITIDKGSSSGIHVDDAVVAAGGVVGQVVRVTGGAAEVRLITDPGSGVKALVQGYDESGVVLGNGENDLRMELVDVGDSTEGLSGKIVETAGYAVGDPTAQLRNVFPRGVPIGRISRVLPSDGDLTKFVEVAPSVDFSSLQVVLVVLSDEQG